MHYVKSCKSMTEVVTPSTEHNGIICQSMDKVPLRRERSCNFSISQQEALRKATLLKHRKVSTQLKLDMLQRQLSELRSSSSSVDRQFYRNQLSELSHELQDLGTDLEKAERFAYHDRRRILRCYGEGGGAIQLSASHPAIFSSNSDPLDQQGSRGNSLKSRMHQLMSSPNIRLRKRHLMGELRAVASLSSLNVKSTPHSSCDDIAMKGSKSWRTPLRFLGHLVDSRLKRRFWGAKRTKSEDSVAADEKKAGDEAPCNGLHKDEFSSSSSSSESSEDENGEDEVGRKVVSRHVWRGPVERRLSSNQRQQVDPALLAEIEDFEKMAAKYIKQHA